MLNRRQFIHVVPALGTFAVCAVSARAQLSDASAWPPPPPAPGAPRDDAFPSHHPFLVKEIVGASHGNIARVTELLSAHPALSKASWEWGFGDWETALGAASHVGNRPIAELLIKRGANPTIFSAAMLGQLDVVKAFAAAMPNVNQLRGPHGIPLINHARAGGPQAAEVLTYLESLGNVPTAGDVEPLSEAERASLAGRYVFGDRPRDAFIVDAVKNTLGITRVGGTRRLLTHMGKLVFHPSGASSVQIRFERNDVGATLSLFDPDLIVRARRA